jgi:hypothetical protein
MHERHPKEVLRHLPDMSGHRAHDLPFCASLLLAQRVAAKTIMETHRHSTITMTRDVYP